MVNKIKYRNVMEDDFEDILDLELKTFGEIHGYSRITIKMLIVLCPDTCFAALDGDEIVGFALSIISQSEPSKAWIMDYCVKEEYRGRGIGRTLIENLVDIFKKKKHVEEVYATVEPDNEPSLRAMEKVGFNILKLDENFYGKGFPRYVLMKEVF